MNVQQILYPYILKKPVNLTTAYFDQKYLFQLLWLLPRVSIFLILNKSLFQIF